ncbi:MAG: shikimate dehydrogenase [Methylobacter sp.]|nr:shikimate dehydrogenase [Methylobacter sp.]MDP2426982.1 shikimate dehydrogenase [Methylobacter sp.]MDP3056193.1 shikimate dehydrogenase [Methylobacter sp.]MDP3362481.1 shikimate dehydrogenase [Methylobacter sp.]MDZ4219809.1 shikimate dehydrogenase [Methylobacter sp.]
MSLIDRYAVFGHPIKHSKSPRIHGLFAEQTEQVLEYTAQDVPAEHFSTVAEKFFHDGGKGLNCTVPLKELAWSYADYRTERAQLSKAVNTLALQTDGAILGDNTDGVGLVTDLTTNNAISLFGIRILVLGAGGASRGILTPILGQSPKTLVIANRTADKAVKLAAEFHANGPVTGCGFDALENQQFDLILNATSASLSGQLPPLPAGLLAEGGNCYDLAYGNEPTAFVRWGLENHAVKSLDGLGMLVEQAAEAFFIWRGVRPRTQPVIELLNSERPF